MTPPGITPDVQAATITPPVVSPMPAGWPGVMSVYPLSQGAAWTYRVVVDMASPDGTPQMRSGEITETVVSATPAIENWVFHLALSGDTAYTWRPVDQYYVARGGGLYRFSDAENAGAATNPQTPEPADSQILAWPLADGQSFGAPDFGAKTYGKYVWHVSDVPGIDVPAGHFEGCYRVEMLTNPDDVQYTFCPGTGFVRYEYRHHGTVQNEIWELVSFTPGF